MSFVLGPDGSAKDGQRSVSEVRGRPLGRGEADSSRVDGYGEGKASRGGTNDAKGRGGARPELGEGRREGR